MNGRMSKQMHSNLRNLFDNREKEQKQVLLADPLCKK